MNSFDELIIEIQHSQRSTIEFEYFFNSITSLPLSDEDKAFLLGIFFEKKGNYQNLPEEVQVKLLNFLLASKLNYHFKREIRPNWNFSKFGYLIAIFGLGLVIIGLNDLRHGDISVGMGTWLWQQIVSDGGTKLLFGGLLIIAGIYRSIFEIKVFKLLNWLNT